LARLGSGPGAGVPYGEVRARFREGDVLAFRGRSPVSAAVRAVTGSLYSHVGLAYLFEGRVYCLEAVGSGVRLCLMSVLAKRYAGGVDYFEVVEASDEQRRSAISFGFQQLGKPFDFLGLARFFVLLTLGMRPRARVDDRWFCAELVAEAYRRQQIRLVKHPSYYASPRAVTESDHVQKRFTIKP
jgi:uncharacterized protein YycO